MMGKNINALVLGELLFAKDKSWTLDWKGARWRVVCLLLVERKYYERKRLQVFRDSSFIN